MEELKHAYIQKLSKALDMEKAIVEHMPSMIEAATDEKLRRGLSDHLTETREHVSRVEQILSGHKGSKAAEKNAPFRLMVETASKEIDSIEDADVRDAVIIAAAQGVEHHEIACYGTLAEWAKKLDEDGECINMLKKTLGEEEAADKKLSTVAQGGIFATGVNDLAAK